MKQRMITQGKEKSHSQKKLDSNAKSLCLNDAAQPDGEVNINWKVFRHDTEAGRLLSRLYGVQPGEKPQRNYPAFRKQKAQKAECKSDEQNGSSSANGRHSKGSSLDKAKTPRVAVPKVGRVTKNTTAAMVDLIPKRRTEKACQQAIKSNGVIQSSYRPPHRPSFGMDTEKERLNEIFAYKGGRALPVEALNPVTLTPSEIACRAREHDQAEKARNRRRNRLDGDIRSRTNDSNWSNEHRGNPVVEEVGIKNTLFDQITNEIKERRQFQMEMEKTGGGKSTRCSVANEIASRLHELKKIDPNRALKVIQELYQT
mmetsp:Transcript_37477/g.54863  ORF Transcript_37477/g.54863 Transcript_37477/m.54863 type:complete len:314 (+) Transcript_37477:64-1005(+)